MQTFLPSVLAGIVSALIVTLGYHLIVVAPRMRALRAIADAHDALLGGGAAPHAVARLDALDAGAAEGLAARSAATRRLEALERIAAHEVPRVGFVRYNAFDDVGSDLSYALALLTREGDGVVLSSIYSREDTRTYGKAVQGFKAAQDPSGEELAAIAKAKAAAT